MADDAARAAAAAAAAEMAAKRRAELEDAPLPVMNIGPVDELVAFDIRNGARSTARSCIISPAIPEAYRWIPIRGIPADMALRHVDKFILCAHIHLCAHMPAGLTATQAKKVSICLGVGRAISTTFYVLQDQDLIPGERLTPMLEWHVPEGEGAVPFVRKVRGLPDRTLEALAMPLAFTEKERAVIAILVLCSIGLVPMQGYSLTMTGHHYLSDAKSQSRKAYDVVEKQFWKSQDTMDWFSDDAETVRDALWHKACHPVNLLLKKKMAFDERVADMLKEAGAGACASRLPALESEMRAANSWVTLLQTVRPLFEQYEGALDFSLLVNTMDMVRVFPAEAPDEEGHRAVDMPTHVTTRRTALDHLAEVMKRNNDVAATSYGFYCALAERSQVLTAGSGEDTLLLSYSLKKLRNQSAASFVWGTQCYDDYAAAKAALRAAGKFASPKLVFV